MKARSRRARCPRFTRAACGLAVVCGLSASAALPPEQHDAQPRAPAPEGGTRPPVSPADAFLVLFAPMGPTQVVDFLLAHGAHPNTHGGRRQLAPLHLAALRGRVTIMRSLLAAGASVNQGDAQRQTPLHYAAWGGSAQAVQVLLEAGASRTAPDARGELPAHEAAKSGHVAALAALAAGGTALNAADHSGDTPLIAAARRGRTEAARWLLEAGADLNARNRWGNDALWLAAYGGYVDTARLLIERGAAVNGRGKLGATPLHAAAQFPRLEMLEWLVAAGADVNAVTDMGATPLFLAVVHRQGENASWLLAHGAPPDAQEDQGITPLQVAARAGDLPLMRMLLDHGADTEITNAVGARALAIACASRHVEAARLLLDRGADLRAENDGWTPMLDCAWLGRPALAQLLLERGASLEDRAEGQTLLFVAARRGQYGMTRWLLDHGADPLAVHPHGLIPWQVATLNGQKSIADLLQKRGGAPPSARERVRVYVELDDPSAQRVTVAGLFNEWDADAAPLRRNPQGLWYRELNLFPGTYEYKFVVDGQWMPDPANPDTERDGGTIINSLLTTSNRLVSMRDTNRRSEAALRQPVSFALSAPGARHVYLAGEFNSWVPDSLPLRRASDGRWTGEVKLWPGEYGYKFVVDGAWMLDPANDAVRVVDKVTNSLVVVTAP